MAVVSRVVVLAFVAVVLAVLVSSPSVVQAQDSMAPAPAPSSDGTSIDQGIAYMLMIVALVFTYLIHPNDAYSFFF